MASLLSKEKTNVIDMVLMYWLRDIIPDTRISFDDLLKVIYRCYPVPEERMDLAVEKHRGHSMKHGDKHHPNKLLDGMTNTYYLSKGYSVSCDWIIFKQKEQMRFTPTRIMIRNGFDRDAVKSVAISWSEDGVKYQDLIQIDDIKMDWKEKQWFELNPDQSCPLKFVKLNILENYGNWWNNRLYEIEVFGFLE